MGQIIGGALLIYLLSKLIEWALIKRIMNDPIAGGFVSVGIAYVLAVIIYGFGSANGGPWNSSGLLAYVPGAVAVAIIRIVMRKRRIDQQAVD